MQKLTKGYTMITNKEYWAAPFEVRYMIETHKDCLSKQDLTYISEHLQKIDYDKSGFDGLRSYLKYIGWLDYDRYMEDDGIFMRYWYKNSNGIWSISKGFYNTLYYIEKENGFLFIATDNGIYTCLNPRIAESL